MSRLEDVQAHYKEISDIAIELFRRRASKEVGVALTMIAAELEQISETLAMMLDKGEK